MIEIRGQSILLKLIYTCFNEVLFDYPAERRAGGGSLKLWTKAHIASFIIL